MADATVERLGGLDVLTPEGDAVRMETLWAGQPIVLVLIRHFG
jgi:hypothetical protein